MKKLIPLFLSSLVFLGGCSNPNEPENPAEKQIVEYTKDLEDCRDSIEEAAAAKNPEELKDASKRDTASNEPIKEKEKLSVSTEEKDISKDEQVKPKKSIKEDFKIKDTDIFFGPIDAKVVVIEYFAFTCPHCNAFIKKTYPKIKEKYIDTEKVAYVFREFIASKQDLYASILVRCKGDVLNYKNFMLALLSQQDSWAFNKNFQELLTNIALLGGVSADEYSVCIADDKLNKLVMDNTQIAVKVPGFVGTPSFFINGKHFTKPYTFEELSKEIDAEIDKQSKEIEKDQN